MLGTTVIRIKPLKIKRRTDQKSFNKLLAYMAFMPVHEKILHASNDLKSNAREC